LYDLWRRLHGYRPFWRQSGDTERKGKVLLVFTADRAAMTRVARKDLFPLQQAGPMPDLPKAGDEMKK